jgi:hypothetical protein
MGLDTKTNRLTDHQSQCVFDFDRNNSVGNEQPFRGNLNKEEEEYPLLKAVTREHLVKTLQAGEDI